MTASKVIPIGAASQSNGEAPGGWLAIAQEMTRQRDAALKQRDDAVDELSNMVDVSRQLGQLGDFLKHALADRDWHRERGDEYAERCDAYLATIDELSSEVAELKRELAWHTETTR